MARYIDLDIAIKAVTMAVHDQFTAVDVVTALEEAPRRRCRAKGRGSEGDF